MDSEMVKRMLLRMGKCQAMEEGDLEALATAKLDQLWANHRERYESMSSDQVAAMLMFLVAANAQDVRELPDVGIAALASLAHLGLMECTSRFGGRTDAGDEDQGG